MVYSSYIRSTRDGRVRSRPSSRARRRRSGLTPGSCLSASTPPATPAKLAPGGQVDRVLAQYEGAEWKIPKMLAGELPPQQAQQPPQPPQSQPQASVSASAGPAAAKPQRRFSNNTKRRLSNVGTELLRANAEAAAAPAPLPVQVVAAAAAAAKPAATKGGRKVSSFGGLFTTRERSFSYKVGITV